MHSANNTAEDIAYYRRHGASGAVGKGSANLAEQISTIYATFTGDRVRGRGKNAAPRYQGGEAECAIVSGSVSPSSIRKRKRVFAQPQPDLS